MNYIGIHKIREEVREGELILVTFEPSEEIKEGYSVLVSEEVLVASRSEKLGEPGVLQEKRREIMAKGVMEVFLKHNMGIHPEAGDLNAIMSLVTNMINNSILEAQDWRWKIHPYNLGIANIHKELIDKEITKRTIEAISQAKEKEQKEQG